MRAKAVANAAACHEISRAACAATAVPELQTPPRRRSTLPIVRKNMNCARSCTSSCTWAGQAQCCSMSGH